MAVTFTNIRVWDTGECIDLVVPDETRDVALDASALTVLPSLSKTGKSRCRLLAITSRISSMQSVS